MGGTNATLLAPALKSVQHHHATEKQIKQRMRGEVSSHATRKDAARIKKSLTKDTYIRRRCDIYTGTLVQ